jgi:hypothetical protein
MWRRSAHTKEKRLTNLARFTLGIVVALSFAPTYAQFVEGRFETIDTVRARDVLPPQMYRSPHYKIGEDVAVRENSYIFNLDDGAHAYQVASRALLTIRTHETAVLDQAIAQFNQQNEQLGTELRGVLEIRSDGVGQILTSPLRTATNLASQLGRNVAETLGERRTPTRTRAGNDTWRIEEDAVAAAHRRTVASQLSLDVYSLNPRVREFLTKVAKARESGNVAAGGGLITVREDTGYQVADGRLEREISALVRRLDAADLDAAVAGELRAMGIEASVVTAFLDNPQLSPRHRLTIAAHLDFLGGASGRSYLVQIASSSATEPEALAWQNMVRMFARFHETQAKIVEFDVGVGLPAARADNGRLVVALPLDLVVWDESTRDMVLKLAQAVTKRSLTTAEILLSGTASVKAASAAGQRGVTLTEDYLGAPRR